VLGVHVPLAGVDAQIPGVPAYPVALPRAVARELPGVPAPVGVGREPRAAVRGAPGDGASATATARVAASALVAVVVLAVFGGVGSLLFGPETMSREQRRRLLPNGGGHGGPARYPREHV